MDTKKPALIRLAGVREMLAKAGIPTYMKYVNGLVEQGEIRAVTLTGPRQVARRHYKRESVEQFIQKAVQQ